jgi:hypothetical protein
MLVDASVGPWAPCRFPSHANALRKLPGLPIGLHQFAEPALSRLAYFGRIADQLAARTMEPRAIMSSLYEGITGIGAVTPARQVAAQALLAYLFKSCDIFERTSAEVSS